MYLHLPLSKHPRLTILTPANPDELRPGPCTFDRVLPIPGFAPDFDFGLASWLGGWSVDAMVALAFPVGGVVV
jgi:hypothetical protein